ncbi:MAG: hypothetical protein NZ519_12305 [Bacteroidia bacterium]|nr:hypothetical protein [Bacteroidia bacterium]
MNFKKIYLVGGFGLMSTLVQAQFVVTNGAVVNINSGETVTLLGINLQNNLGGYYQLGGTINHNGT